MNSRILRIALPVVVVLALAGWAAYEYFIVADSPDEVTTEAALEQLSEDLAVDDDLADEPAAAPTGVIGTWTIDDDFGDFDFENASGSFAGFRVDKALFVGGGQTAVGRSGDVSGSIEVSDGAVTGGEVVVDMSALQSDISQRESAIASAVKSSEFPTATFVVTDGGSLDTAALEAGETVTAPITGELTIAGVTNTVTISAEATVAEPGLALIVGAADLVWADYGVDTPTSSAGTVADEGILEFQLIVRLG